jgi:hypothetical protein
LDDCFEFLKGAEAEVIADAQPGIEELNEFLCVVLFVQDLTPQVALLFSHIIRFHLNYY